MFWHTDPWKRALVAFALATPLGCGDAGQQILGTVKRVVEPDDGGTPDGKSCVGQSQVVRDVGLEILFILDRSARVPRDDWYSTIFVLNHLRYSTDAIGLGVGLIAFPRYAFQSCLDECTECDCVNGCGCSCDLFRGIDCDDLSCAGTDYKEPDVPIGRLPGEAAQWVTKWDGALSSSPIRFGFGSPALRPALDGSLQYIHEWEADNPDRRLVQVVIAGSAPPERECDEDPTDDEDAFEACLEVVRPAKPRTYVIALNADSDDHDELDQLASAGRTGSAFKISRRQGGPDVLTRTFSGIIDSIRSVEGQCEYTLPTTGSLDADKVNLFLSGGGDASSSPVSFKRVATRDACIGVDLGWYYDNPNRPTRIHACPETCTAIHADPGASVSLSLGCETLKAPPAPPLTP